MGNIQRFMSRRVVEVLGFTLLMAIRMRGGKIWVRYDLSFSRVFRFEKFNEETEKTHLSKIFILKNLRDLPNGRITLERNQKREVMIQLI